MNAKRISASILWIGLALMFWEAIAFVEPNSLIAPRMQKLIQECYPSFALFGNSSGNDYGEATRVLTLHSLQTAKRAVWGLLVGGFSGIVTGLLVFSLGRG